MRLSAIVSRGEGRDGQRDYKEKRKRADPDDAKIHGGVWRKRLFVGGGFGVRDFGVGEGVELAADDVGGEAGAKETAVERGELVIGDFAAGEAEFAFDALADESGFVMFLGIFFKGGFDVFVGDAAGAEVARDAEAALPADLGALAGELFGVAGVVDEALAFEAFEDVLDELVVVGAMSESLFHFMDGVGAAHEDAGGGVIKVGFGGELAGAGKHRGRIEAKKERSKEKSRGAGHEHRAAPWRPSTGMSLVRLGRGVNSLR